jgi:hypothetical protein
MELHPTPESWRIALLTAIGAFGIGLAGAVMADVFHGSGALLAACVLIGVAALATLAPAVGTLTATVDADSSGVAIRRFGRTTHYSWSEVVDVRVIERRASVPDGTEYHWVVPRRRAHVVAVPCLALADGRLRELPALAAPATGPRSAAAREYAALLERVRSLTAAASDAPADGHLIRSA